MNKTTETTAPTPYYLWCPLEDIAGEMGASVEHAGEQVRRYGYELATDDQGRVGVGVETAARVVARWRDDLDAHQVKWAAYQDYLAERRQAVLDERQAAAVKAAEETRAYRIRYGERMSAKREAEAQAAAAQSAAEQAAKLGRPVDFATFARKS